MATFFENLGRILSTIKGVEVQYNKAALLINAPITQNRRQTVKVTATTIRNASGELSVARFTSRSGFVDNHVLVRKSLEFNSGKQRFGLCLSNDSDPPALDAVAGLPIDIYDEQVAQKLWQVIREIGAGADNLERQLGGEDEL